jgi:signal transduction histidine kinase
MMSPPLVNDHAELNERTGLMVHELRNALAAASYAAAALELGNLPMSGSTGAVLKRSLETMKKIVDESAGKVDAMTCESAQRQTFALQSFIEDAANDALVHAQAAGCRFAVAAVDPLLEMHGDRERLLVALANVLQNAFKSTRAGTEVALIAYAVSQDIIIDVKDHCDGLPEEMRANGAPASGCGSGRSGLGPHLPVARSTVEAEGGVLIVQEVPDTGCVFTIKLPRYP